MIRIAFAVLTFLAIAVFAVGLYVANSRFDAVMARVDRYVQNEAINACAESYRTETTNITTGVTTIRPMEQQVRECAWQKGVREWDGVWSDLVR